MTSPKQLPAIVKLGALATAADTHLVPALIADAGEPAAWRYIEFFTANIRNPNTRRAYALMTGKRTSSGASNCSTTIKMRAQRQSERASAAAGVTKYAPRQRRPARSGKKRQSHSVAFETC
jgi:hypothetical protein